MSKLSGTESVALEALVDRYTLSGVVEALAAIAGEKAEHVLHTWLDEALSTCWSIASAHVESAADSLKQLGL